ncbi:hypothetical protein [Methylobacterium sp. B4]|uniref:hypothetical protein n=1 Tax=Methylobacterium sp. B4 TaxID=1938755 RepID=UPI0011B42805|nr:hypothetical protein [Methylobacterium sp. B4]
MRALNNISPNGDEHVLSPIAWALIELDEIGYVVTGASIASTPRWQGNTGSVMTSCEIISFTIEATAHASSRRR